MKLGEKLKNTLKELQRAQLKTAIAQHKADLEKIRKERQKTMNWLYGIRDDFIDQIDAGKVPVEKINDYDKQKWLELAQKGNAASQDIWKDFTRFWKDEGLEVIINDCHDGVGLDSWKSITMKPLPDSDQEFDYRCRFCGITNQFGECKACLR